MNDYIVTIDLRGCKISNDSIKKTIKNNANILVTNEKTKVIENKMLWNFSSEDNAIEDKVNRVITNMHLQGSIYGGKIDKQ